MTSAQQGIFQSCINGHSVAMDLVITSIGLIPSLGHPDIFAFTWVE